MQPRQRSKCSATVSVQLDRPVERRLHQPDPAARRVHLLVPELVGRAGRQAEAAVDAVVDQLASIRRAPVGVERRAHALGERRPGAARRGSATIGDAEARAARAGTPARRTATRAPAARLQLGALLPDAASAALAGRRARTCASTAACAALEEQREAPRRQEVDGARHRAASAAARPRARAGRRLDDDGRAAPPAADAAAARRRATRPSRPREPEKSLPRS